MIITLVEALAHSDPGDLSVSRLGAVGDHPHGSHAPVADRRLLHHAGLGYTINLLTLLALVLAIGLVVDDAIIVVENVHRHMEDGMPPLPAAIKGARELAGPIIAISVVLIAVYVPIGFMGGLTGALFTEFAYTLAGAVAVSAVIALTLSPMMCSRFLKPHDTDGRHRFAEFVDRQFGRCAAAMNGCCAGRSIICRSSSSSPPSSWPATISSTSHPKTNWRPQEDQGSSSRSSRPPPTPPWSRRNSIQQTGIQDLYAAIPETDHVFQFDGISGLKRASPAWSSSHGTSARAPPCSCNPGPGAALANLRRARGRFPAAAASRRRQRPAGAVRDRHHRFLRPPQRGVAGIPGKGARASGMFAYVDTDLKIDKPQTTVEIDRDKAAQLGLTMRDVGGALGSMLGGGYVNYFSLAGRSYKVIPQVSSVTGSTPTNCRTTTSTPPAASQSRSQPSSKLKTTVVPESLNHFQQLNSATISAVLAPGVTLGQALDTLKNPAQRHPAPGLQHRLCGHRGSIVQESSALARDVPLRADHHFPRAGRACSRVSATRSSSSSACRCPSAAR